MVNCKLQFVALANGFRIVDIYLSAFIAAYIMIVVEYVEK